VLTKKNANSLGKCPNQLKREFFEAYKDDPEMQRVDAFLCNHACSMCELFMPFNKSLIVIASTRQVWLQRVAQVVLQAVGLVGLVAGQLWLLLEHRTFAYQGRRQAGRLFDLMTCSAVQEGACKRLPARGQSAALAAGGPLVHGARLQTLLLDQL
jgi:hypothetical protein